MEVKREIINKLYDELDQSTKEMVASAVSSIIKAKKKGGKIVVVTGSGPNLHEGITTLIAELINKGIIDGVTSSSAVIAHEMAGVLDEVKRVDGIEIGFSEDKLPRGNIFEITKMSEELLSQLRNEMLIDDELIQKGLSLDGDVIIKAAGNMAYPMGLRSETLSKEILHIAKSKGISFEEVAGAGADGYTMLGAAKKRGIPCLVTVPQLIGGGMVGIALADSISIMERTSALHPM